MTPIKKLQDSCQETTRLLSRDYSKMIEYVGVILLCTLVALIGATAYYLYSLLKMAEASINDLLLEVPYNPSKSDVKRQKVIECVLTRNSKQYLRKAYTEEQVHKLSADEVDKLLSNYKVKLSGQMVSLWANRLLRCI